ncbi:hypothetical protein L6R50_06530 [Myxococcota bacterium]|nr:hypothetical protein [Myxococcota bacterium]
MGFWKKVAGAFVEFEGGEDPGAPRPGGLVPEDLSDDAEALIRELGSAAPSPRTAPTPPPPPSAPAAPDPAAGSADVQEGIPFERIYAEAGVPPSHYTVEQLLAVIERLRALPREQALVAIEALDAADERWTVADVVADADRKTAALKAVVDRLGGRERAAGEGAAAERTRIEKQVAEADAEVRRQIAALEAEMAGIREEAAAETARIDAALRATREACARERTRVGDELNRIRQVPVFLSGSQAPRPADLQDPKSPPRG